MRVRKPDSSTVVGAAAVAAIGLVLLPPGAASAKKKACPDGMAAVQNRFCIDQYEASVVEAKSGDAHSPFEPVDGLKVKAVSRRGAVPQGYITRNQAEAACRAAGKRLCADEEWLTACRGKRPTTWPYGEERRAGVCNDAGRSSFNRLFGPPDGGEAPQEAFTWDNMNDTRLNQMEGTLAPAGSFKRCRSSWNVYDMVGNLHEWTAAASGTFRGGYYLDTVRNGEGCDYKTTVHGPKYRDYSTGFRCCK